MTPTLYHYTCNCGRAALERQLTHTNWLWPTREHTPSALRRIRPEYQWMLDLIWLTDMAEPNRRALGLTSVTIACDRTQHRYRVVGGKPVKWTHYAAGLTRKHRLALEGEPGAMPAHWWLSTENVPVVYDPLIPVGAR